MNNLRLAFSRVSAAALYLLALSLFLAPAGVAAALVLLWVGFAGEVLAGRRGVAMHPLVWLAGVFALYVLAQPLVLGLWPTSGPPPDPGAAADWARLVVFVPVGYAVAANRDRLPLLLLLVLLGMIGGMVARLDWALLLRDPPGFFDARDGFGFGSIAFGLYSGTALLGLVLLRGRCWQDAAGRVRWWRVLPWLIGLAVVFQGFLMTKSRGSWLALLVGLAVGLWLERRERCRSTAVPGWGPGASAAAGRRRRLATAAVVAIVAAMVLLNGASIVKRVTKEWGTVQGMVSGEIAFDRSSSVSLRWNAQLVGLATWAERPWLGWGAGTTRALMDASGNPAVRSPKNDRPLKHLHDTYLELAVQLGLVGLLLFLALHLGLIGLVARQLRVAGPEQGARRDILVFLVAALVLLLVWDLFDVRAVRQDWRAFWALLAGAALGLGLRPEGAPRGRPW